MKGIFDLVSNRTSEMVTKEYSTSFSLATKLLGQTIRQDIYNIYGFVRLADEIVDSFSGYEQERLFNDFEKQMYCALEDGISLNPVLNAFQHTYHKYDMSLEYVEAFMKSMRADLNKRTYNTKAEYEEYIYGSADVVGLMCLQVFVKGDKEKFSKLKDSAEKLGSAFQKVNFLRDLKQDFEDLGRTYFPNTNLMDLDECSKLMLIKEIEMDFEQAYNGILQLPMDARFGVFVAYRYYKQLLKKIANTPAIEIKNKRIRVNNYKKMELLTRSFVKYQLNLL
ncbi:MAG: phytoene/squalene synthase family protein [Flavobacteriaceae bacterium]|nr:phytoene/squalene synthase family protein [Mangrovimonas sp.]MCB0470194.1 phytoene/squalene synthase family protein [Flavobacteriaceae bacterium]MCB0435435.1 phytoene/squalene synthase family protein [Mangrovimonas sp.]MCB0437159.1 phytoene/squalene synthase family protein [Mangrovimonas sp.]HPF95925.1 phytoene/squalene synthase family protein [Mangrovimonas sp.]